MDGVENTNNTISRIASKKVHTFHASATIPIIVKARASRIFGPFLISKNIAGTRCPKSQSDSPPDFQDMGWRHDTAPFFCSTTPSSIMDHGWSSFIQTSLHFKLLYRPIHRATGNQPENHRNPSEWGAFNYDTLPFGAIQQPVTLPLTVSSNMPS